jgi:hypothetical protein
MRAPVGAPAPQCYPNEAAKVWQKRNHNAHPH